MHLVHVESDRDLVTGLSGGSRLNTSGKSIAFAVEVQIGLCAHQLGNFNVSRSSGLRMLLDELRLVVYVFRTDAEDDLLQPEP